MSNVEKYRQRAEFCRTKSEQESSPAGEEHWLHIAMEWQRLADAVQGDALRNSSSGSDDETEVAR
jgi:hypothetical protein